MDVIYYLMNNYPSYLKNQNLLMIPMIASSITNNPIQTKEVWSPNSAEHIQNQSIPIISHNFPTNSPTPVIVPSSSGLVQSEIYAEITGRISESPNEIPKVITIIFRNPSLNQSNIYNRERKNSITNRNFLLLPFPAISQVKKSMRYGNLIAAKTIATCDKLRLLAIETIGIKINPT